MSADDVMSYSTPYLAALRLLAKGIDQAALLRFDNAVALFTLGAEKITAAVQEFERLEAELRMQSERSLIQKHPPEQRVA